MAGLRPQRHPRGEQPGAETGPQKSMSWALMPAADNVRCHVPHQLGARFADLVRLEEVSAITAVSHWPEPFRRSPLAVARSRLDPPPSPVSSYLYVLCESA